MSSKKLSEATAVSSSNSDDLVYLAHTTDAGVSYASRNITVTNLFDGYATESYVSTQISNLVDGAPAALDTLNELAAALNDDASAASSLTTLINANETHIDNMATLTGVAKDSTDIGTFTGSTISDNGTIAAGMQELETAVEGKQAAADDLDNLSSMATGASTALALISATELEILDGATVTTAELNILDGVTSTAAELNILDGVTSTAAELNILDGVTSTAAELNLLDGVTATTSEINILSGVSASASEINILAGTSVDSTEFEYLDGVTSAIQTQIDNKAASNANISGFVGDVTPDTAPEDGSGDDNFLFVVVDKSDGSLKVISKQYLELE